MTPNEQTRKTMKVKKTLIAFVLLLGFLGPWAFAHDPSEEETRDPRSYRGGSLRLGAFWTGQIDTSIILRSAGAPAGLYIDLSKDLKLSDSVTVPRGFFSYRFSRRHQVNFSFFQIHRESRFELKKTIEIGEHVFPEGSFAEAFSRAQIYKAAYTWLFYDRDKVVLGLSFGLNIIDFDFGLNAALGPEAAADDQIRETAGVTAPLPVIGLRLAFRVTPKLGLVAAADLLDVEYGKYGGTFRDAYAILDWRFSKHVSVGGGINSLNLGLELEEEVLASFRRNYRGAIVFLGVHF